MNSLNCDDFSVKIRCHSNSCPSSPSLLTPTTSRSCPASPHLHPGASSPRGSWSVRRCNARPCCRCRRPCWRCGAARLGKRPWRHSDSPPPSRPAPSSGWTRGTIRAELYLHRLSEGTGSRVRTGRRQRQRNTARVSLHQVFTPNSLWVTQVGLENVACGQHFFTWLVPLEKCKIAQLLLISHIRFATLFDQDSLASIWRGSSVDPSL